MTGAELVARWFVENKLPTPYTQRDLEDLADRIDDALRGRWLRIEQWLVANGKAVTARAIEEALGL